MILLTHASEFQWTVLQSDSARGTLTLVCDLCLCVWHSVPFSQANKQMPHNMLTHSHTVCVLSVCTTRAISQSAERDGWIHETDSSGAPLSAEDESVSFSALNLWCRLFSWLYWKQWCNKQSEARAWSRRFLIVLRSDHLQNQEIQSLYF